MSEDPQAVAREHPTEVVADGAASEEPTVASSASVPAEPAPIEPATAESPIEPPAAESPPEPSSVQPLPEPASATPASEWSASLDGGAPPVASQRPEIAVGASFAGGFLLAMILKRFAR